MATLIAAYTGCRTGPRCRSQKIDAVPVHEPVPQLAQALRAAREAKGFSQVKLSQRSGVALSFINELENCRTDTTTHTLLRLTRALGTTISDLFRDIR